MEVSNLTESVEIPLQDMLPVDDYRARGIGEQTLSYLQGITGEPNADLGVSVLWVPGTDQLEDYAQRRTAFVRFDTNGIEPDTIPNTGRMGVLAGEVDTITEFVSPDAFASDDGLLPVTREEIYRFYTVSDTAQGAIVVREKNDFEAEPDAQHISEVLSASQIVALRDELHRNEPLLHL